MLNHLTPQHCPGNAQIVVLDTNVVLDWMVFANPEGLAVGGMISSGRWHWVATTAMRAELDHVLARGRLARWRPDLMAIDAEWVRRCAQAAIPATTRAMPQLRCADPDDQKFIDLAIHVRANWLFSRDAAVLKLARSMRPFGVSVTSPAAGVAVMAA